MGKSSRNALPDGVFSDGERLWRAKPGALSTFEENVSARDHFRELHADQFWNPWRMDEEAASLGQAMRVMEEWERAEPGFRRKSDRELEVEWAAMDREFEREQTAREAARQEQLLRYDKERAEARLALLEAESVLDHKLRELAQFTSGEAFPRVADQQRGARVMELEEAVATRRAQVKSLRPVVGDPEDVPDASGDLPADRRVSSLYSYRERRINEVKKLRLQLPDLDAAINGTDDRAERSKLRAERDIKRYQLDKLLAVPRLDAKDMCADCPTPSSEHGWVTSPFDGPCHAWPGWAARVREARRMLEEYSRRRQESDSAEPARPKAEPLAVIPSGLPIAEVIKRMQELSRKHPEAEVRRGRANRWELWPADQ